jgi:YVTN family beta-propeller protein
MKSGIKIIYSAIYFFVLVQSLTAQEKSGYRVLKTFHIASAGGWDYIAVGPDEKLYVSHGTQVNILNKLTGDSLGFIPNTTGAHGIAFISGTGKGYTSNGRLNTITVFDLKTAKVLSQIAVGENPDAIIYEPFTKKIITCNGRSKDLSIVDPATEKVVATIPVGGKPETAVSDGKGMLYVNNEDKSEIVVVDLKKNEVVQNWSIAPGEAPTGLAYDPLTHRLFAGCEKMLVVINSQNGKIVDKLVIGDGCDGVGFDSARKLIFASCGEGVLSIIREVNADQFVFIENIPTKKSARTLVIDEKTHNVYLPAADMEKQADPKERPHMIPGSFQVLVVNK